MIGQRNFCTVILPWFYDRDNEALVRKGLVTEEEIRIEMFSIIGFIKINYALA